MAIISDNEYLILLSSFLPFGSKRIAVLISYFGSAENTWKASDKEFSKLGLNVQTLSKFLKYRQQVVKEEFFDSIKKKSVQVVTQIDPDYPQNLKGLDDAPVALYVRGNLLKKDLNAVAIVGSRKITSYGKTVAERFATEFANLGITVVSGLAFGVDLEAHRAALNAGGRCIAVLAGGVDLVTPKSNEWLGKKILENGGAIVSEFPLGTVPQKQFFPFRNRIISGLSKAVVVVEGAIKSGTIHTARHAAEQGRPVFAVPGAITSPMSEAPHFLIQNGAKLAAKPKDVIDDLDLQIKVDTDEVAKIMPSDPVESKLYEILEIEEKHLDDIVRELGLQVSEISGRLTVMELKGMVKNMGNGVYRKC